MAGFRFVTLSRPVGRGGANDRLDVTHAQELLNAHLPPPLAPLRVDGVCGPLTEAAIAEQERRLIGAHAPDARLDPSGPTLRALNHLRRSARPRHAPPPPAAAASPRPASATPTAAHARAVHGHAPRRTVPPEVIAAAQRAQAAWGAPASITIAQWMLESGWGRHMPQGSNNPFGIKAAKGQRFVMAPTTEEVHGRTVHIMAPFRVFDSMDEAFDEHGKLLHRHPAYAAARAQVNNPDGYADALTHTYATESTYGSDLKSEMRTYDLYQYNRSAPASSR